MIALELTARPSRAAAWNPSVADKLSVGGATQDAWSLLGRPDHARRLLFHRGVDRWSYESSKLGVLPGESLTLDFVDGKLARKERRPDAVEERKGFVLGFGMGAAAVKTTGTRSLRETSDAGQFDFGWAPSQRLALLIPVTVVMAKGAHDSAHSGQVTNGGVGIRLFPVMPWYIEADYGTTKELVRAAPKEYNVAGRGYCLHAGYELGYFRKGAFAPELFYMKTHSNVPDSTAPIGVKEDLRSTVWGVLLKYVWYP
jgi:hypothetical protein